ncbi:hypothetical protein Lgor_1870 [Fluoribacter gormanii]|uniref:Uncharacterized protein n=1 Tax=Fluoribacter gormanii TaxID=464 RepID=A0A377GL16_9GAMM|nr:hypothetical protein Lgor_1870 [Fluoribacter gormanii]SIR42809.1 hypothetical protein SAMN05421777_1129 [Fluoribacter gormanii]STO25263.1 Uncharacterised protein [Fluoribacter gormanii]
MPLQQFSITYQCPPNYMPLYCSLLKKIRVPQVAEQVILIRLIEQLHLLYLIYCFAKNRHVSKTESGLSETLSIPSFINH